jgi:hypothetical protein
MLFAALTWCGATDDVARVVDRRRFSAVTTGDAQEPGPHSLIDKDCAMNQMTVPGVRSGSGPLDAEIRQEEAMRALYEAHADAL